MKAYIKVDVTKELPEEREKYYLTNRGWSYCYSLQLFKRDVEWWLKEIDLSELMIEFAQRIIDEDWNYTGWTKEDVLNKFLTEKGYITNNQNDQPKTKNKTY